MLAGTVVAKAIHNKKIGNWGMMAGLAMGFSLAPKRFNLKGLKRIERGDEAV